MKNVFHVNILQNINKSMHIFLFNDGSIFHFEDKKCNNEHKLFVKLVSNIAQTNSD